MSEIGGMILSLAHRLDDDERTELGRLLRLDTVPATSVDDEPLLSCAEAAWRAGCHVETVRRAVSRGALKASRAGRNIRIAPADLAEWLRCPAAIPKVASARRSTQTRATSTPMHDALALLASSAAGGADNC